MNEKVEILKWFDKSREILEENMIESKHILIIQDLINILYTFRRVTEYKDEVQPLVLKNIAYLRLTSWALAEIFLPECKSSDIYKNEIIKEDPHLRWNLGLREDFGKGYNIN